MADIFKSFVANMNGIRAAAIADAAAKTMAEHCDKRIEAARKAIKREEKYLLKVLRAKNTGGVMAGDIEGAFARLRSALGVSNG